MKRKRNRDRTAKRLRQAAIVAERKAERRKWHDMVEMTGLESAEIRWLRLRHGDETLKASLYQWLRTTGMASRYEAKDPSRAEIERYTKQGLHDIDASLYMPMQPSQRVELHLRALWPSMCYSERLAWTGIVCRSFQGCHATVKELEEMTGRISRHWGEPLDAHPGLATLLTDVDPPLEMVEPEDFSDDEFRDENGNFPEPMEVPRPDYFEALKEIESRKYVLNEDAFS